MADGSDTESLADLFWTVARRLRHDSRDTLVPFDLAPSHSRALRVLVRHGDMRLSELSTHLGIAARSTTEVVDALEARGFVERRADPSDRRATLVHVTHDGTQTMSAIRAARQAESAQTFDRLSARDRADLGRLLRKLTG